MSNVSSSVGIGGEFNATKNPPIFLWLYFPPVMIAASLILRVSNPDFYYSYMEGELGIVENATVLLLLPAFLFALSAFIMARSLNNPLLLGWILLNTIGCFYFMGEEASWGQHWFGWSNEGIFADHPRGETNIHNTNHWFDQKPKVLVEFWTMIGGIIVPAWLWIKSRKLTASSSNIWYWIWPTYVCFPTAVICLIVKNIERGRQSFHLDFAPPFDIRFSEPQEYYFGLFFLIYMLSLFLRVRQEKQSQSNI
ncbi:hypothetical protein A9Q83_01190 [Alphaproteobacteria bacterium 46_93_T64]|nr:hypothetical protein A9Q83_01190 [Alphaproteobacteria bacterium 46_93_T64]